MTGKQSDESSYRYSLLGIIAVVGLVAVVFILRLTSTSEDYDNIQGKASAPYGESPSPIAYTLAELEEGTYTYLGTTLTIRANAITTTPRDAVFLSINGDAIARVYEGNSIAVGTANDGSLQMIDIVISSIDADGVHFSFAPSVRTAVQVYSASYAGQQIVTDAGTVTLSSAGQGVTLRLGEEQSPTLFYGDSTRLGSALFTIVDIGQRQNGPPYVLMNIVPSTLVAQICNADGQNSFCRGNSACCGGTCMALPDCAAKSNGLVGTCGARSLYCCSQKLSFSACGGTP